MAAPMESITGKRRLADISWPRQVWARSFYCPWAGPVRPPSASRRIDDAAQEQDAAGPVVADQEQKRVVRSEGDGVVPRAGFVLELDDDGGDGGGLGPFLIHLH